jgi:Holliday junction resolvasome RuvABC endonuclease subunit
MVFAGFDLGANAGYSILDVDGGRICSGTWKLGKRTGRSLSKYRQNVYDLLYEHCVCYVGFEKVNQYHRSKAAAVAYGGYESLLMATCHDLNVPLIPIKVHEVKKQAAGTARADKDDMEASVMRRWNYVCDTPDEADSLWICECARLKVLSENPTLGGG